MPRLPSYSEIERACAEGYDFAQAEQILSAMDFLRKEALKTGMEEIAIMVDSAFRILLATYCSILRYDMGRLLEEEAGL